MTRSTGAWSTEGGPTSCSPPSRARSLPRSISPGEISSALRRSWPPLAPAALGALTLLGADLGSSAVESGGRMHIVLYWRGAEAGRLTVTTSLGDIVLE